MFRCLYCGATFDEPSIHRYVEDMNGEGAYQTFFDHLCPCCGDDQIEALPEPDEDDDEAMDFLDRMAEERREWEELHT